MFRRKERQTCPRRMTDLGPWERAENLDTWIPGPGMRGNRAASPHCSFCGSLHPGRFLELIREGWIVGPTDKDYKAYLGAPVTDEDAARAKDLWLDQAARTSGADRDALAQMWDREHAHPTCGQEAKFYYQHLSEAQAHEFIDLYNDKTMRLGYPGHFYRLPYFITTRPTT